MERSEREAILRLLHAVAGADGPIRPDEERVLEAVSGKLGVATTYEEIDIASEATRITSSKTRVATFEAAVAIATIDGACTADEHIILEKLRTLLEIAFPISVVERETRWSGRLGGPRKRMAAAEVDFLHKMKNGPGIGEYCALVADLHRVSVEALRDELDPALEGRASYFDLEDATGDLAGHR